MSNYTKGSGNYKDFYFTLFEQKDKEPIEHKILRITIKIDILLKVETKLTSPKQTTQQKQNEDRRQKLGF